CALSTVQTPVPEPGRFCLAGITTRACLPFGGRRDLALALATVLGSGGSTSTNGRSPNSRRWLSGGHEAWIGPSTSSQSLTMAGPLNPIAPLPFAALEFGPGVIDAALNPIVSLKFSHAS